MVNRKKKTKMCERGSHEEDWISKLPDSLICDVLFHLPTKDAVSSSVLSTRWRNLWQWVPGLDLESCAFSGFDAFVNFFERFCDSHKDSSIQKLRLCMFYFGAKPIVTTLIDAVTMRRIQHVFVDSYGSQMPLGIYTCVTLVHLHLCSTTLPNAEFVSLPCLKIIYLDSIYYPNEVTLEKLISGSPVLEDLTMIRYRDDEKVIRLCSQTVKRIHIDHFIVVIDAPLLQCLRTRFFSTKNFKIIHSGFPSKLDVDGLSSYNHTYNGSFICDILMDISRVRELVIRNALWKHVFLYSKLGPVL